MRNRHYVIDWIIWAWISSIPIGIGLGFFFSWQMMNSSNHQLFYYSLIFFIVGFFLIVFQLISPMHKKANDKLMEWVQQDIQEVKSLKE